MSRASSARVADVVRPSGQRPEHDRVPRTEFRLFSLDSVRQRLGRELPAQRFIDKPFASVQLLAPSPSGCSASAC
jgi:hypothetical protein